MNYKEYKEEKDSIIQLIKEVTKKSWEKDFGYKIEEENS